MLRSSFRSLELPRPQGAALATVLAVLVLLGVVGMVAVMTPRSMRARGDSDESIKVQAVAEAGINDGLSEILAGRLGGRGSATDPIECGEGAYWVSIESFDAAERSYRLTARATYAGDARTIE